MTRLLRLFWNRFNRRSRLASSIFCRMIGCTAEIMKNSQSRSPKPIVISFPSAASSPRCELGTPSPPLALSDANQRRHRHAHDEAADMRPPRHAAGDLDGDGEADGTVQQLHREPQAQIHAGRDLEDAEEYEDERH